MSEVTTELGMRVPVSLPVPSAWSGGVHDGSRLTAEQRAEVRQLWAESLSASEIARRTGHSRNTITAIVAADPEVAEHLRKTRAARMLVEEDMLLRERGEVIEAKAKYGKLSIGDLNSALMIGGIAIKDAGGAAPLKMELKVEHEFSMAASLMAGMAGMKTAAPFAPPPPVLEAEMVESPGINQHSNSP